MSVSGQCCDVYGFSDDLKGIEDVPIARVSKRTSNDQRCVHILIFNQAIYFGASLDHSLINTYQIRNLEYLCLIIRMAMDKILASTMKTSLYLSRLKVQLCIFNYCVPTDAAINTCPHMILTYRDLEWDPHDVLMAENRPYGDHAV